MLGSHFYLFCTHGLNMTALPWNIAPFKPLPLTRSFVQRSHTVDRGTFPHSDTIWYRKEMESPFHARNEWLAQEFLRLIIPYQPHTHLAVDDTLNIYYVLS